jgi:2-polyprenyl-3-methyl-5-hydroxy-6-metoxy-1,4-benzoquinol methylase
MTAETGYAYNYLERKEMLQFVPDSCLKILEVGCGDGSFAVQLLKREGTEIWGVEMHEESAKFAARRLHKVLIGEFEQFINREIPESYFDCIIFNDVLEHFLYPDRLLLKIKKLLVPGGYIITSLPNFRNVGNLWEIIIDKDFRYKPFGVLDYTHFRFFTMKSIRRMFDEADYEIIEMRGINRTKSIKVRAFNFLAFNFFSDIFYMQIATVAKLKQQ